MLPLSSPLIRSTKRYQGVRQVAGFLAATMALTAVPVGNVDASAPALRVGVAHVPPEPGPTDIRLYTPEGFDVFLAREIARGLGRPLELVQIPHAAQRDALKDKALDLVLTRISKADPLAQDARIIETGFSSGISVAMRSDTQIRDWNALADRTVCVSKGNEVARSIALDHHARIREEDAPALSLMRVRTGECDAAIHDDVLLKQLFAETGWQKFSATLPAENPTQLVAAINDDNTDLADQVAITIAGVSQEDWRSHARKWATNVAFEVYLDQDAPDCH